MATAEAQIPSCAIQRCCYFNTLQGTVDHSGRFAYAPAMADFDSSVAVVVPCYNEENRLPRRAFLDHARAHPKVHFLFVNDGSQDQTKAVTAQLAQQNPAQLTVLDLGRNHGKAEAVRQGMVRALNGPWAYAGYMDADLATPLAEITRFCKALDDNSYLDVVLGSRVKLLGRVIERRPWRHYLGRIFATAASNLLDLPVYDTQCGAKFFRTNAVTRALFDQPFATRWLFDVELLARLIHHYGSDPSQAERRMLELPLWSWRDEGNSKLSGREFAVAALDLARLVHIRFVEGLRRPPISHWSSPRQGPNEIQRRTAREGAEEPRRGEDGKTSAEQQRMAQP
jgi:glycosyltransferase involved in cell wall biosynthesis